MGDKIISTNGEFLLPENIDMYKVGDSVYLHRTPDLADAPSFEQLMFYIRTKQSPPENKELFLLKSSGDSIIEFHGGYGDITFKIDKNA